MDRFKRRTESIMSLRDRDRKRCIDPYWKTERGIQQLKEWAEKVERWNHKDKE